MPAPQDPDRELLARAAGGDAAAVTELYRRHAGAALRAARSVTQNQDDAADAVSESFARMLQSLQAGRLGLEVQFRAYLVTASRRAAIDLVRSADRTRPTGRLEELDMTAGGPQPPDRLMAAADASLVGMAFRSLPGRWREVLWLTEVDGLAPKQAAVVLGLSANGTAQLALRARAALRSRYHQQAQEAPASRACSARSPAPAHQPSETC